VRFADGTVEPRQTDDEIPHLPTQKSTSRWRSPMIAEEVERTQQTAEARIEELEREELERVLEKGQPW
jgi:hypothetical protein